MTPPRNLQPPPGLNPQRLFSGSDNRGRIDLYTCLQQAFEPSQNNPQIAWRSLRSLQALQYHCTLRERLLVRLLHELQPTWAELGAHFSISAQAAQQRYGGHHHIDDLTQDLRYITQDTRKPQQRSTAH